MGRWTTQASVKALAGSHDLFLLLYWLVGRTRSTASRKEMKAWISLCSEPSSSTRRGFSSLTRNEEYRVTLDCSLLRKQQQSLSPSASTATSCCGFTEKGEGWRLPDAWASAVCGAGRKSGGVLHPSPLPHGRRAGKPGRMGLSELKSRTLFGQIPLLILVTIFVSMAAFPLSYSWGKLRKAGLVGMKCLGPVTCGEVSGNQKTQEGPPPPEVSAPRRRMPWGGGNLGLLICDLNGYRLPWHERGDHAQKIEVKGKGKKKATQLRMDLVSCWHDCSVSS